MTREVIYGDSLASSCAPAHCWIPAPDTRWPVLAGIEGNRARAGTEVSEWAANVGTWASSDLWDWGDQALVLLNTNSAWDHTWPAVDLDQYHADLEAFASHLYLERGFDSVLLLRPPEPEVPGWTEAETAMVAWRLDLLWSVDLDLCGELDFVTCSEALADPPPGLRGDGIHWNAAGHDWAAAQLVPEPATVLLVGAGLVWLAFLARWVREPLRRTRAESKALREAVRSATLGRLRKSKPVLHNRQRKGSDGQFED